MPWPRFWQLTPRVLPLVLAAACGGREAAPAASVRELPPSDVDARALPYEPCSPEVAVGGFVIELDPEFTDVDGQVFDGVDPNDVPVELAASGSCRLLAPPTHLCDPGCPFSSEVCAEGNRCVPRPSGRDLGTVSVRGLAIPLDLEPNPVTNSYLKPATPRLPHPGFEPGAALRLVTSGGDYEPFELWGWGVSLLELAPGAIVAAPGNPVALAWDVPEDAGPARVHVDLNVNVHGSSRGRIECDFADVGAATIPAELLDQLFARGRSGYPTIVATRRTATSVSIAPGCVELSVAASVSSPVEIPGLISCTSSAACPPGQTCRRIERLCE